MSCYIDFFITILHIYYEKIIKRLGAGCKWSEIFKQVVENCAQGYITIEDTTIEDYWGDKSVNFIENKGSIAFEFFYFNDLLFLIWYIDHTLHE